METEPLLLFYTFTHSSHSRKLSHFHFHLSVKHMKWSPATPYVWSSSLWLENPNKLCWCKIKGKKSNSSFGFNFNLAFVYLAFLVLENEPKIRWTNSSSHTFIQLDRWTLKEFLIFLSFTLRHFTRYQQQWCKNTAKSNWLKKQCDYCWKSGPFHLRKDDVWYCLECSMDDHCKYIAKLNHILTLAVSDKL